MLSQTFLLKRFSQFVPAHSPPDFQALDNLRNFFKHYNKILVLTGAGVSTESGIPDYRSENVGVFARSSYKPILYTDFIKNPDVRARYWARNYVGWPRFKSLEPNEVHNFVAFLQGKNQSIGTVTQNVDGLHHKAGNTNVIELHGNAFWVHCVNCKDTFSRFDFQTTLKNCNPSFNISEVEVRPDGDVELDPECVKNFVVPPCEKCGGILKPTIVFFGDNVPAKIVEKVENLVDECDSMLILGTTLTTLSSYRIVKKAFDLCKFLCLVNIGATRGDELVDLKINAKLSDVLLYSELS